LGFVGIRVGVALWVNKLALVLVSRIYSSFYTGCGSIISFLKMIGGVPLRKNNTRGQIGRA